MKIRKQYGHELKEYLEIKAPRKKIGMWAYSFYWKNITEIDSEFEDILLAINKMELGEEFYLSYEELDKIADDLILGRKVII